MSEQEARVEEFAEWVRVTELEWSDPSEHQEGFEAGWDAHAEWQASRTRKVAPSDTDRDLGVVAMIHVKHEDGVTESWPIAERVPGGWQSGVMHYPDAVVAKVLAVYTRLGPTAGGEIPAPESREYAEFEAWEQAMWVHQPVLSIHDGGIVGCQCLDRVFVKGKEDWGSHLASIITARLRASQPVQVEVTDMEAVIAGAMRKSDDENHEQLCACRLWPESCATYGDTRPWSHDAEFVARAAFAALGGGDHAE